MKTTNEHTENEFPTLDKLKGKNSFSTPVDYFDSLTDSIINQVAESNKSLSFYTVFGSAASVAILAGICSLFFIGKNDQPQLGEFGQLTVSEYYEEFSEADLEINESLQFDEIAMTHNEL